MSIAYRNVGKKIFCPTSWADKLDLIDIPGDNNWNDQENMFFINSIKFSMIYLIV